MLRFQFFEQDVHPANQLPRSLLWGKKFLNAFDSFVSFVMLSLFFIKYMYAKTIRRIQKTETLTESTKVNEVANNGKFSLQNLRMPQNLLWSYFLAESFDKHAYRSLIICHPSYVSAFNVHNSFLKSLF